MEVVGPFTLAERLGAGAQGEVRRAVHVPTGTAVAVKLTPLGPAADRLQAEVGVLADLDHPHVIRLWGAGTTPTRAWMAMELAKTTLAQDLPTDWDTAREVLVRLLSALGHLHARGVLHLDIKPGNVLLGCEDGPDELEPVAIAGLRLADFGAGGTSPDGTVSGTPGYAPPEQLRGRWRELGPATDLYALGETAWRCLTHRRRLAGSPTEVLRAQLRHDRVPFAPVYDTPPAIEGWLDWLLDPRATARPQRAIEALEALEGLRGSAKTSAAPAPASRAPAPAADVTWIDDDPIEEDLSLAAAPTRRAPAPARGWEVAEVWGRVRWLLDGGLGPVRTRMPRFVGRRDERADLWRRLQTVRETGRPALVRLRGVCPGAGASRLAAWLGGRAHEADQAVVLAYQPGDDFASLLRREARADGLTGGALAVRLRDAALSWGFPDEVAVRLVEVVADGVDPLPLVRLLPADRPLVLLHDLPGFDEPWSPHLAAVLAEPRAPVLVVVVTDREDLGGDTITVGPLHLAEADALAVRWMGLSRPLADEVIVASGGVPGAILQALQALDAGGRLRSTPDGFAATGALPDLPSPLGAPSPAEAEALLWTAVGGAPAPAPSRWTDPEGWIADRRVRDAVLRALPPVDVAAAWARAAELPAPPSVRALRWRLAGRPERAREAVEALVSAPQAPDLAAVELARLPFDADHPDSVVLPARITARRGLRRGARGGIEQARALCEARGWDRARAMLLELDSWATTSDDRALSLVRIAEAEALFAAVGDLGAAARCRRRRAGFTLDLAERESLLLPDLADPAMASDTLVQLATADPLRWRAALAACPSSDPWIGAERERVLAEAASFAGDPAEARARCAAAAASDRARVDRVWATLVGFTRGNVERRAGDPAAALGAYLAAAEAAGSIDGAGEAEALAAGTLLRFGDGDAARRVLSRRSHARHPVVALLRGVIGAALDLWAGEEVDSVGEAWRKLWAERRGWAAAPYLKEWEALVRREAERRGASLPWPGTTA